LSSDPFDPADGVLANGSESDSKIKTPDT